MTIEQTSNDHITAIAMRAFAIAHDLQHEMIGLEHILVALLERADVRKCLRDFAIDHTALQTEIGTLLTATQRGSVSPIRSREFEMVLGRTIANAQFSNRRVPNGLDVLAQLILMPEDSPIVGLLSRNGLSPMRLKRYMAIGMGRQMFHQDGETGEVEPTDKSDAIGYIKKYCTDLNELARLGKIDPVIGRVAELHRMMQIIARRSKNNVALVGESGVGKTSIVEGLAHRIVHGDVPRVLSKSIIWSLDVAALVAGTRLRGDFEERMKFLLRAFSLIEADESILFIDEIHTIMDAGSGHKGSLDVSNLLKPALARGDLRCIGSTTDKDWRQHFEKDRALLRRFKKLLINEPSISDTKLILRGVRAAHEKYHDVIYTDAALDAAVDLTVRYLHDGRLPDKAIDLIDEAGARQRITDDQRQPLIDVAQIEAEIAQVVQIPTQIMHEDEASKLRRLETDLIATVFGQPHAIKVLTDAVMISRAGLRDVGKPAGSFLFVGPSGVGKTETARQLAKTLRLPLLKFDMSEYMERHSVSKLIGAPPGYVGFGDGAAGDGLLINAVDTNSACVLLLDEVEKAYPDIFNVLLQVMDDAKLTNSAGKTVSFRNVILIMTSNAGIAGTEQHGIGFHAPQIVAIDEQEIQRVFSPEFRNRLDAIVPFAALDADSIICIVQKFLDQLTAILQERGIVMQITDAAQKWLAKYGHDPVFGARPLGRLIDRKIKQPLSRLLLFGGLQQGGIVRIAVEDGDLVIT